MRLIAIGKVVLTAMLPCLRCQSSLRPYVCHSQHAQYSWASKFALPLHTEIFSWESGYAWLSPGVLWRAFLCRIVTWSAFTSTAGVLSLVLDCYEGTNRCFILAVREHLLAWSIEKRITKVFMVPTNTIWRKWTSQYRWKTIFQSTLLGLGLATSEDEMNWQNRTLHENQ